MATLNGGIGATDELIRITGTPPAPGTYFTLDSEALRANGAARGADGRSFTRDWLAVDRGMAGTTKATHSNGATLTPYYPDAPGGGGVSATDGIGGEVAGVTELRFPGAVDEASPGVAAVQTFTWTQVQDPAQTATPEDGQTWLETGLVEADGQYRLYVWFDLAGGWCGVPPSSSLRNVVFGSGSRLFINNDGSFHITGLPTSDPAVAGQLFTDGAPSAGVPKAIMVSGG